MRWSIRWRLTLWNLLALAAVLLGFAGLVYGLISRTLYENTDRNLLSGAQLLEQDRRLTSEGIERLRYLIHELHEHQNLLCVLYATDGSFAEKTEVLAAESVPPPVSMERERRFWDTTLPLVGRQRALATPVRVSYSELSAVLLAPLADVDHELGRVAAALASAVPAAMLVAGGLGYVLARRALAPVDRLRALTEEVTAERLDRRLPVANAHDELGRLATTINAMIGRLERSFAEIRRFTADASHELRTPLAVLRSEAELAKAAAADGSDQQQVLCSVLEECDCLTRLTDQLARLIRLDPAARVEPLEPPFLKVTLIEPATPLDDLVALGLANRPELAARQMLVQARNGPGKHRLLLGLGRLQPGAIPPVQGARPAGTVLTANGRAPPAFLGTNQPASDAALGRNNAR